MGQRWLPKTCPQVMALIYNLVKHCIPCQLPFKASNIMFTCHGILENKYVIVLKHQTCGNTFIQNNFTVISFHLGDGWIMLKWQNSLPLLFVMLLLLTHEPLLNILQIIEVILKFQVLFRYYNFQLLWIICLF